MNWCTWHRCDTTMDEPSTRPRPARTASPCTTVDKDTSIRLSCLCRSPRSGIDSPDNRRYSPRNDLRGNLKKRGRITLKVIQILKRLIVDAYAHSRSFVRKNRFVRVDLSCLLLEKSHRTSPSPIPTSHALLTILTLLVKELRFGIISSLFVYVRISS